MGNNVINVPDNFKLYQNFPNPFNPITIINYDIPSNVKRQTSDLPDGKAGVKLIIYNTQGKEIAILVNEKQSPGSYSIGFNGMNYPSGIYFYQVTTEGFSDTKRMIMIK